MSRELSRIATGWVSGSFLLAAVAVGLLAFAAAGQGSDGRPGESMPASPSSPGATAASSADGAVLQRGNEGSAAGPRLEREEVISKLLAGDLGASRKLENVTQRRDTSRASLRSERVAAETVTMPAQRGALAVHRATPAETTRRDGRDCGVLVYQNINYAGYYLPTGANQRIADDCLLNGLGNSVCQVSSEIGNNNSSNATIYLELWNTCPITGGGATLLATSPPFTVPHGVTTVTWTVSPAVVVPDLAWVAWRSPQNNVGPRFSAEAEIGYTQDGLYKPSCGSSGESCNCWWSGNPYAGLNVSIWANPVTECGPVVYENSYNGSGYYFAPGANVRGADDCLLTEPASAICEVSSYVKNGNSTPATLYLELWDGCPITNGGATLLATSPAFALPPGPSVVTWTLTDPLEVGSLVWVAWRSPQDYVGPYISEQAEVGFTWDICYDADCAGAESCTCWWSGSPYAGLDVTIRANPPTECGPVVYLNSYNGSGYYFPPGPNVRGADDCLLTEPASAICEVSSYVKNGNSTPATLYLELWDGCPITNGGATLLATSPAFALPPGPSAVTWTLTDPVEVGSLVWVAWRSPQDYVGPYISEQAEIGFTADEFYDFDCAGNEACDCWWNGSPYAGLDVTIRMPYGWEPLSSGMNDRVLALDGSYGDLIAGGWFTIAGDVTCSYIARWNGSAWQPLGSGMNFVVEAVTFYDGDLIAGGYFTTAGGVSCSRIARWDGSAWQPLGSGMNEGVHALTVYNGELIAGGWFTTAGGVTCNRIARWNGSAWQPLGSGMNDGVQALTVYNGELIAGGRFTTAGGVTCNYIARWNGSAWQPLGSGMGGYYPPVRALTVYNGELIAGGYFTTAGGVTCNRIARWNGSAWQPLGSGMDYDVYALTVYNNALIAGGWFTIAGDVTCNHIARWNGSAWQALGSGMNREVDALTVYNGELIAGGDFWIAGGVTCNYIARWVPAPGACCHADGSCAVTTQAECTGVWHPEWADCIVAECLPATGACCYPNGSCAVTTEADCTGVWHPEWPDCIVAECPQPPGACCFDNGTCQVMTEEQCTDAEGNYLGDDTDCEPNLCLQPDVACCFASGLCQMKTAAECQALGGQPGEYGTTCTPNDCPPCTGDLNCDGTVNFGDINPFVLILSNFQVWQQTYSGCPWQNGDIDGNGSPGFEDINPFVALIVQAPIQCEY